MTKHLSMANRLNEFACTLPFEQREILASAGKLILELGEEAEIQGEIIAQLRGFAEAHKTCRGTDEPPADLLRAAFIRGFEYADDRFGSDNDKERAWQECRHELVPKGLSGDPTDCGSGSLGVVTGYDSRPPCDNCGRLYSEHGKGALSCPSDPSLRYAPKIAACK